MPLEKVCLEPDVTQMLLRTQLPPIFNVNTARNTLLNMTKSLDYQGFFHCMRSVGFEPAHPKAPPPQSDGMLLFLSVIVG
jgi:hypothetical protein